MRKFATCAAIGACALGSAHAATVTFDVTDTQGSDSSDVRVVITDLAGGNGVTMSVTNLESYSIDILGLFFDLNIGASGLTAARTSSSDKAVTALGFNTTNLTGGNNVNGGPGGSFDVGMTVGNSGSSGGPNEPNPFGPVNVTISLMGLDVSDFLGGRFAVRAQSVNGNGSSKEFGLVPDFPDIDNPVPVPAAALLFPAGIGLLAARRRRRR